MEEMPWMATVGWGTVLADNLAVWALPKGVPIPENKALFENLRAFIQWFRIATVAVKPPYFPSPAGMPSPASCWGTVDNALLGNLYYGASHTATLGMKVTNLFGERRNIALRVVRTDWVGNANATFNGRYGVLPLLKRPHTAK